MKAIQELKDEIYNLGPSWNLFGKVDRMKELIDQIEQAGINTNVGKAEVSDVWSEAAVDSGAVGSQTSALDLCRHDWELLNDTGVQKCRKCNIKK